MKTTAFDQIFSEKIIFSVLLLFGLLIPLLSNRAMDTIYDDESILTLNHYVSDQDFGKIWTTPYWEGIQGKITTENLYRPLFLSLVAVFKDHGTFLKLLSLLTHLLAAVLVFLFLRQWSITEGEPFLCYLGFAAILFHPANVEVSAQVVGMMDSLVFIFGFGALLLKDRFPWAAIFLAALSPGWKEVGYLWIVALGFLKWREKDYRKVAILGVSLFIWLFLRYVSYGGFRTHSNPLGYYFNPVSDVSLWGYLWSVIVILGYHVKLFFWPYPLTIDYSIGTLPLPGHPLVWLNLLVPVLLIGLYLCRKQFPFIGWVCLLSVISTLDISRLLSPFAERFGYGFRVGLLLLSFLLLVEILQTDIPKKVGLLLAGWVLVLAMGCAQRNTDWQSAEKLFQTDSNHYPENPKLHYNLAITFAAKKEWIRSRDEFLTAIHLLPDFPEAHYRLGIAYSMLGDRTSAQGEFQIASREGFLKR